MFLQGLHHLSWSLLLFTLLACCLLAGPTAAEEPADSPTSDSLALDLVLKQAGVSREALLPDPVAMLLSASSSRRPPLLRAIQSEPLKAPWRVGSTARRLASRTDSPHRLLIYTAGMGGTEIARGYFGNPLQDIDRQLLQSEDPLLAAIQVLEKEVGTIPIPPDFPTTATLSNPLRFEVARVIASLASTQRFLHRALRDLPADNDTSRMMHHVLTGRLPAFDDPDYRLFLQDLEQEALVAGALDLVAALEDFHDFLNTSPSLPPVDFQLSTPAGDIILAASPGDHHHQPAKNLLLLDLAGNDTYFDGADYQPSTGISVVYDRTGNDRYTSAPGLAGAAVMGISVLWDAGGSDHYQSESLGQAASLFGVSLLFDQQGDDVYQAVSHSQAWAVAGVSLLADLQGNDRYESVLSSQASAGPAGTALLLDASGNDVYLLKNDPLLEPSAQSAAHNVSMGQGAGFGVRADLSDGRSTSGGTGFLLDLAGDDRYTAQVFCQGTGFLEGAGLLADLGGNDQYEATWYGQASAAHRAAGVLLDLGTGNDSYNVAEYTSIACGHDYSTAFLLDEGGNDSYSLKNLGLGAGNDNGIGIFVDAAGDDRYAVLAKDSYGLGAARIENWGTTREASPGVGLFLDLAGTDNYARSIPGPSDNTSWRWPRQYPQLDLPCEKAAGLDGEYPLPFYTQPRTPDSGVDEKRLKDAWAERRKYRQQLSHEQR